MSSQITGVESQDASSNEFGANEWLVDELYEKYIVDKNSVAQSWWPILERYRPVDTTEATAGLPVEPAVPSTPPAAEAPAVAPTAPTSKPATAPSAAPAAPASATGQPVARTTSIEPKPQPIPAEAPRTTAPAMADAAEGTPEPENKVTPIRGMAKALVTNMNASLTVPTATSVRTIPAKLMIDNRIVINNHLKRSRGGKVSFTHLIGWA
ncbi:MAG TPA: 2-oxo acid dehydrogenase subunit E2, partial [Terrimesophilobacter sp.]|nr:2-oxo acid dehydrogenase subunit E2 [Terrimesophilobacter sp.]